MRPRILQIATLMVLLAAVLPLGSFRAEAGTTHGAAVERLLRRFAAVEGLEASYREEKRMALLAEPLVSEGTLHYVRPGRLARHQRSPTRATVLIEGDVLRFGDVHGSDRVDLSANPVVRMFVDSFLGVLSGEDKALARIYDVRFSAGEAGKWRMRLQPRTAPMNKIVAFIELRGTDVVLEEMTIVEHGGDATRTVFLEVDPRRRYTTAELRDLFRLP